MEEIAKLLRENRVEKESLNKQNNKGRHFLHNLMESVDKGVDTTGVTSIIDNIDNSVRVKNNEQPLVKQQQRTPTKNTVSDNRIYENTNVPDEIYGDDDIYDEKFMSGLSEYERKTMEKLNQAPQQQIYQQQPDSAQLYEQLMLKNRQQAQQPQMSGQVVLNEQTINYIDNQLDSMKKNFMRDLVNEFYTEEKIKKVVKEYLIELKRGKK